MVGRVVAPRWRTVLFDLDGTLVDTVDLILASYAHAGREVLGQAPDPVAARRWIGRSLSDIYGSLWPERADELTASYRRFNEANFASLARRFPGVPELLGRLRAAGVVCAVATSKGLASAEASLDFAGLTGDIELAATAETTTAHKPNPAPLLAAAERLGGQPAGMVYVGDAVVDAQAARAAGMACLLMTWGAGRRPELEATRPDGLADDADQLGRLLLENQLSE